jgi:hypothetical protein
LHDTTRDEIEFFEEDSLTVKNQELHRQYLHYFDWALEHNARERSRRFENIDSHAALAEVHEAMRKRSVSLFEPRPELNHATNSLCIVGRRALSRHLFLDRRSFLNSYDYTTDPEGNLLVSIMRPLGPVCGGINLEYFFSRVDNQKLGAGTKLPHNVMGLIGVANGIDGDLRPGLPSQMIELHDPLRLLIIVEHIPQVVLAAIQKEAATYEWFINQWVWLAVIHPQTNQLYVFRDGDFHEYEPLLTHIEAANNLDALFESHQENLPVYSIPD